MSGKSLNTITKTGTYIGGDIPELIPYVGSSAWCIIQANVQTDNAASFDVITSTGSIINIYRENGTYKFYPLALKSDLPNIYGVQFEKNNEYSNHVQTIKNIWNKFPDNKPFVCTLADSNKFVAVGYIYENRKYGAVLYLAFNSCGIVKCADGTFSDTKL